MSTNNDNNDEAEEICASCGITGGDDIKLKKCTACKLVRYCSVACQKEHRRQHKRACKQQAAELREELLFKQPESSNLGDCPICLLPLPLDSKQMVQHCCCSKLVCNGCNYLKKQIEEEESLEQKCPFCRVPCPITEEEADKLSLERVEANDPFATRQMGWEHEKEHNFSRAFELYTKAAGLGDVEAHAMLASLYVKGEGVEQDYEKELHHLEEAAIRGHPGARYRLGWLEEQYGSIERAVKHYIIAANLGMDPSINSLKDLYKRGLVEKEDFAAALRAHKAAIDATKSPQREEAQRWYSLSKAEQIKIIESENHRF